MCIRRETWEKALQSLTFSPISKPHTHITYMLRQCTSIVYVLIDILRLQLFYYNTILFRSCDLTLFLFWEKKMLYHSIYNIYFAAIFVALSNSTFSNSSFNLKWQIRSLHQGQFWLKNEIIEKWLKPSTLPFKTLIFYLFRSCPATFGKKIQREIVESS